MQGWSLVALLRGLPAALALLTRIPVPFRATEHDLHHSAAFFPLVGLLLGCLLAGSAAILLAVLGPELSAAFMVVLLAAVTGGLHLDGVADVFDAVGGARGDRVRALAIMKDPRIGAHGAVAVCLLLLVKTLAFTRCLSTAGPEVWLLLPAASRLAASLLVTVLSPARGEGLGRGVAPASVPTVWLLAGGTTFAVLVALGLGCWPAVGSALASAVLVGAWAHRRFGGFTGDVLGVVIELSEVTFATAMAIVS